MALLLVGAVPPTAQADEVDLQVVNDGGVGQVAHVTRLREEPCFDTGFNDPSDRCFDDMTSETDGFGRATLDLRPDDELQITRGTQDCGAPPEGETGVVRRIGASPPASLTVSLPSLTLMTKTPAVDSGERGVIGAINDERRALGFEPVEISQTLSRAADAQANLHSTEQLALNHCARGYSATLRGLHFGWPLNDNIPGAKGTSSAWYPISENLLRGTSSARRAFEIWMGSQLHREAMLDKPFRSVGIGQVGGYWSLKLAAPCPETIPAYSRCEMTGDYGDADLLDQPPPPTDSDGDGVPDAQDSCPQQPANTANGCPPSADGDGDGVNDGNDNCPNHSNAGQQDADGDDQGDACDSDRDGDGVANTSDACPGQPANTANGCPPPPPPPDTDAPRIQIGGVPTKGCTSDNFNANVTVTDDSGLKYARLYLDGEQLVETQSKSFTKRIKARRLDRGEHTLKVRARDKAGNSASGSVDFKRCR